MSRDDVQDRSEQRKHDRAESVERIMEDVERDLGEQEYPVRNEELAEQYADQPLDMPNETESLGSVFDRMSQRDEYDTPEEVREALYGELSGRTEGKSEANEERNLDEIAEDVEETESL
ncbi:hypothetical protein ACFPYI_12685 [Halomarina salina]|uniref:DUF2795 domain-containing protein n=1 Tax=Halomarina salina TaxID=1872699 RepID=A0ABD5RPI1_9EURY|nr:hypothetical protein [Halomarina salina]